MLADVTVFDLETTGLRRHVSGGDRVIEIAAIRISSDGNEISRFTTLVNPQRDVGPTHIHGITSRHVAGAPNIAEVLPYFCDFADGSYLASFNYFGFDAPMLFNEFKRCGYLESWTDGLCIMNFARELGFTGSLIDVSMQMDLAAQNAHFALGDTVTAANVFARLGGLKNAIRPGIKEPVVFDGSLYPSADVKFVRRSDVAEINETPILTRIGISESAYGASSDSKGYQELLAGCLEDRVVSEDEVVQLRECILDSQISYASVMNTHRELFRQHCLVAMSDEIITSSEKEDLETIAAHLGIAKEEVGDILASCDGCQSESAVAGLDLRDVKAVCFTGESNCLIDGGRITRQLATDLCSDHGIEVKRGVSKKIDALIVSDSHTQSGKAKKAHSLGVRVIIDRDFWVGLGHSVG